VSTLEQEFTATPCRGLQHHVTALAPLLVVAEHELRQPHATAIGVNAVATA
jgi:hypothetical protein